MTDVIYSSYLRVGLPVAVISPPDADCDHDIIWGVGEIESIGAGSCVVRFNDGNGGRFGFAEVYPLMRSTESVSWREVSAHLRLNGWKLTWEPLDGLPPYVWRSPDGVSGPDYRGEHPDGPPDAVMRAARAAGLVDFTEIAPA